MGQNNSTGRGFLNGLKNMVSFVFSPLVDESSERTRDIIGPPTASVYDSPLIIDSYEYDYVVGKLREFFKAESSIAISERLSIVLIRLSV